MKRRTCVWCKRRKVEKNLCHVPLPANYWTCWDSYKTDSTCYAIFKARQPKLKEKV